MELLVISDRSQQFFVYVLLFIHGFTAFLLNISNFEATRSTSPLVINITGNVKQVCMIVISVILFHQPLTTSSVLGCILTIAGSFWYSVERYNFDNASKKIDPVETNTSDQEPLLNQNGETDDK